MTDSQEAERSQDVNSCISGPPITEEPRIARMTRIYGMAADCADDADMKPVARRAKPGGVDREIRANTSQQRCTLACVCADLSIHAALRAARPAALRGIRASIRVIRVIRGETVIRVIRAIRGKTVIRVICGDS